MDKHSLIPSDVLSAEIGVPVATLAQWRYLGTGPTYFKVGASVRYRRREVDEWIESNRVEASG